MIEKLHAVNYIPMLADHGRIVSIQLDAKGQLGQMARMRTHSSVQLVAVELYVCILVITGFVSAYSLRHGITFKECTTMVSQ